MTARSDRWIEVGDGVLVRRHAELDLSTGLVLGERSCVVVDTRGDPAQGAEFAAAVRKVTSLPWLVVLTHAHFDHCLGTSAFLPTVVWAHRGCRVDLARGGAAQHGEALAWHRAQGRHGVVPLVEPVLPDRVVDTRVELDLGARRVLLAHLGAGHTDHDVVVGIPDARMLFAGDLVEQGAPPAFEDAHPLHWPATLTAVLALGAAVVIPGHGEPVDAGFVTAQRDELAELAALCRGVHNGEYGAHAALARSPFDEATTRTALARAGNPGVSPLRPQEDAADDEGGLGCTE
ncbi:MAG TPA: MBL fold metallo-hydrolase [Pseudonocardiaceae bacterium]|jgi:glyoxylase-like metal-dependent hydrolase (beta-lactamase superfamily II)|nr:MBL fold metallo-hydrolase [Pseudonocardiaceae bacterium]